MEIPSWIFLTLYSLIALSLFLGGIISVVQFLRDGILQKSDRVLAGLFVVYLLAVGVVSGIYLSSFDWSARLPVTIPSVSVPSVP